MAAVWECFQGISWGLLAGRTGTERATRRPGPDCGRREVYSNLDLFVRTALLAFGSGFDETGDIGFEFDEIFVAEVHHVSRVVILQVNVFLELVGQAEMFHGVFGGVKRRSQIVESVF